MAKKAYVGIQGDVNLVFDTTFSYNEDQASFMSNDVLPEKFDWGETMHFLSIDINGTLYTGIYIFQDFAQDCWIGSYESNDWSFNFNVWRDQHCEIHNDEELYPFDINQPLNVKVYIGNPTPTARKLKIGYVGIPTEISTYEENDVTVTISNSNITNFFDVTNGSYYFKASSTVFSSTNFQVASSSATSTWIAKQDIKNASFDYVVSSESGYDKFTVVVKGTTIANAISGESEGTWTGSLNKGDAIQLTYTKDGSANNGNDCGIVRSFNVTYSQKTLISTEIKEVARKVKKAYVSIGGFARPCWGGGDTPTYYGEIAGLSYVRYGVAATSIGDYALFTGGVNQGTARDTIDAYDKSLTLTQPATLYGARYYHQAVTLGDYAIIWGGQDSDGDNVRYGCAFNKSLTRTNLNNSTGTCLAASTTIGDYAIFAGGCPGVDYEPYNNFYTINSSLTANNPGTIYLPHKAECLAATTVGNHALFSGGYQSTSYYGSDVTTLDASLTKGSAENMSTSRYRHAGATVGNYALFAGGVGGMNYTFDASLTCPTSVDVYDSSLVHTVAPDLAVNKRDFRGVSFGDYAVFSATSEGRSSGNSVVAYNIDAYDTSLTKVEWPDAQFVESGSDDDDRLAAAVVGNYLIFASSYSTGSGVEAYTLV